MKIGFIGTGVFSVSIAINLAQNKANEICMWSEDEKLVETFKKNHKLTRILPKADIPENIHVTNDYAEVLTDAKLVFVIPSIKYLENVCQNIKTILPKRIPVLIGTKGIDENSGKFAIDIASHILKNPCYLLAGPNFAKDIAHLDYVGCTISYKSKKGLKVIKNVLSEESFKLEFTSDSLGISICSVLKNIYAIGSGMLNGLGLGDSTNALYITEVYKELEMILSKCKSSYSTLYSFAGLGDLMATCHAKDSRNFTYGSMLGKKSLKKDIKKFVKENTIEGYASLEAMHTFLNKKHIKAPILETIYGIVIQNKTVKTLTATIKNN